MVYARKYKRTSLMWPWRVISKRRLSSHSLLARGGVVIVMAPLVAGAQPPATSAPPPAPPPSTPATLQSGPLSVPAKSLMQQRLHPAVFPGEAEVRCGTSEACAFGLTRGFTLGADVFGMATTPILRPQVDPGGWLFYDGFIGYQFLNNVDDRYSANGSVGYRGFSYTDSDDRKVTAQGVTFRVAYAQEILAAYSQGLVFDIFAVRNRFERAFNDPVEPLRNANQGGEARQAAQRFYKFSQDYPQLRVGFPADLEVINWKASHVDLPNDIRGYLRVEPFYVQNQFRIENEYGWQEKNFGLRTALTSTYEAPRERSGRYALLGSVGFELSTSEGRIETFEKPQPANFQPKRRPVFDYFLNAEASYQF